MLRLASDILLIDTSGLLAIALVTSCLPKRREQTLLRFIHKRRVLILVLFPWITPLVWLEKPGRQLRRRAWRYRVCYLLLALGVTALMLIGAARQDDGIVHFGLTMFVWMLLLDRLIRGREDNGGNDDHHHDEPPDNPTPTGDAADRWLQSQQTLTNHS